MTWSNVRSLRGETRQQRVALHLERRSRELFTPDVEALYQQWLATYGPADPHRYDQDAHQERAA